MIAHKEGDRIERSLRSVVPIAHEIIVVIQDPEDKTGTVARRFGALVHHREWTGFADQKNHALSLARHEWILQLDADEVLTESLQTGITHFLEQGTEGFNAASFAGRDFFHGRWLRYGTSPRLWRDRLVRRGCSRWLPSLVHESQQVHGRSTRIAGVLHHYSIRHTRHMHEKYSRYADLFVAQKVRNGAGAPGVMHILARSAFRFFRSYVLRLGILDGYPGLLYALHLHHYTLIRYSRLREYFSVPEYRREIDQILAHQCPTASGKRREPDRLSASSP